MFISFDTRHFILFYLKAVYIKSYKFKIECIIARCMSGLIDFSYELEA